MSKINDIEYAVKKQCNKYLSKYYVNIGSTEYAMCINSGLISVIAKEVAEELYDDGKISEAIKKLSILENCLTKECESSKVYAKNIIHDLNIIKNLLGK